MKNRYAILVALLCAFAALGTANMVVAQEMTSATMSALITLSGPPEEEMCFDDHGAPLIVIHIEGSGPATSSDPRLSGTFKVDATIVQRPDGTGISWDNVTIVDSATGQVKVSGTAIALDPATTSGEPIRATVVAKVFSAGQNEVIWAQSRVMFQPDGKIKIEYGMAPPTGTPAPADRMEILNLRGCVPGFNSVGF